MRLISDTEVDIICLLSLAFMCFTVGKVFTQSCRSGFMKRVIQAFVDAERDKCNVTRVQLTDTIKNVKFRKYKPKWYRKNNKNKSVRVPKESDTAEWVRLYGNPNMHGLVNGEWPDHMSNQSNNVYHWPSRKCPVPTPNIDDIWAGPPKPCQQVQIPIVDDRDWVSRVISQPMREDSPNYEPEPSVFRHANSAPVNPNWQEDLNNNSLYKMTTFYINRRKELDEEYARLANWMGEVDPNLVLQKESEFFVERARMAAKMNKHGQVSNKNSDGTYYFPNGVAASVTGEYNEPSNNDNSVTMKKHTDKHTDKKFEKEMDNVWTDYMNRTAGSKQEHISQSNADFSNNICFDKRMLDAWTDCEVVGVVDKIPKNYTQRTPRADLRTDEFARRFGGFKLDGNPEPKRTQPGDAGADINFDKFQTSENLRGFVSHTPEKSLHEVMIGEMKADIGDEYKAKKPFIPDTSTDNNFHERMLDAWIEKTDS